MQTVIVLLFSKIFALLGPATGAVKGFLNAAEIGKAVLTALGFSSIPALVIGVLTWIQTNESHFVTNSAAAYLISGALGLVIDLYRRLNQGVEPGTVPGPSPATAMPPAQ